MARLARRQSSNSHGDTLTGIAYVPATKTLWMSANSAHPLVYDPRSAQDVTEYMLQEATSALAQREAKERTQRLFRIQQTGELVASTNTRQLVLYQERHPVKCPQLSTSR